MNRSLIFRDALGRFSSKPVVQSHTKDVNPLSAVATVWDEVPYSYGHPRFCYAVDYLNSLANRGELRGFDWDTHQFDFANLSPRQHFWLGSFVSTCNSKDTCKSCSPLRELYGSSTSDESF